MKESATSLDRLHDIVEPPPVPWWPPAPGWYVLMALAAGLLGWLAVRQWKIWRANAYRRAALRELESARTAADVSEVLRRTALCVVPRSSIASLTGKEWASWLSETSPEEMPNGVRTLLTEGVYQKSIASGDLASLTAYAASWIHRHRLPTLATK